MIFISKLFFLFLWLNITTFAADADRDERYHPTHQPIMYGTAKNVRVTGEDAEITFNTVRGSGTLVTMHTDVVGDIIATAKGAKVVVGGQERTQDAYYALNERDIRRREHLEEEPFREHPRPNPLCCAIL